MALIIDMHAHLGDVLYPGGGDLIEKKGVRKRLFFDILSLFEAIRYSTRIVNLAYQFSRWTKNKSNWGNYHRFNSINYRTDCKHSIGVIK